MRKMILKDSIQLKVKQNESESIKVVKNNTIYYAPNCPFHTLSPQHLHRPSKAKIQHMPRKSLFGTRKDLTPLPLSGTIMIVKYLFNLTILVKRINFKENYTTWSI